jgi:hypothetical protein
MLYPRMLLPIVGASFSMFAAVAAATPTIVVGNHVLLPNKSGQNVAVPVTGGDQVMGANVNVQVADGGPPNGGTIVGPAITGLDLITNTIFTPNNDGQQTAPPDQLTPQAWNASVVTTGSGSVAASGTLATATFDTTGIAPGAYALRLANTLNGDTDFGGVAANLTNGNLVVVYPGDANLDGTVGFPDLLILAQHYGATTGASFSTGDFNYDNKINFSDLLLLAQDYGKSVPINPAPPTSPAFSVAAVPEPASAGLVGLGSLALLSRRRRM